MRATSGRKAPIRSPAPVRLGWPWGYALGPCTCTFSSSPPFPRLSITAGGVLNYQKIKTPYTTTNWGGFVGGLELVFHSNCSHLLCCDFIARLEYDNKNALLDGVPGATPGSTASTWVGCLDGLEAGVYKVLLLELATDPNDRSPI